MKIKQPPRTKAMDDAERRRPKKIYHGVNPKVSKREKYKEKVNDEGGKFK